MGKRATNSAATKAAAAKKAKLDPALASVGDVIKNARHLPERCRSMLVDLLPFSLALTADVRSERQKAVVSMLEETMMVVKAEMETEVVSKKEKQQSIEASMAEQTSVVDEANVAVEAQKEVTKAAKSALDDATTAMNDSHQVLVCNLETQKSGDEKLVSARDSKDALEMAFKEHFQTPMENSEAPNYSGLEKFLHQLDMEESLLTALAGTCEKSKASRGNFDDVVLTQFDKAVSLKIASFKEIIDAEMPASVERADQVKHAEAEHGAKKQEHKLAEEALEAAKKDFAEREAVLDKAKETMNNLQQQLEDATALYNNSQTNSKSFEDGPLANFSTFKSKAATPAEAAPAGA